jgi:tRNA/tmRNA/rRNA uracil-C5-methylase (TrmA/RlmC/RlmD family)
MNSDTPSFPRVEIEIRDVVYGGRGLGRTDGCVLFVPGVLPGEVVRARVIRKRKNYWEGELVEVLTRSDRRREPACALSGVCPGCCYQHMDYEEEIRLKQAQLLTLLERQAGVSGPVTAPPFPSPAHLEYRNKIVLHAATSGKCSEPYLGYLGYDNKTLIDVPRCELACPAIGRLAAALRRERELLGSLPERTRLTLRHTDEDGAVFSAAAGRKQLHPPGSSPATRLLAEKTALGLLRVPLGSFFQTNPAVADAVLSRVSDLLRRAAPAAVVDLYCGAGVFALAARRLGISRVLGLDSDRFAIEAARANAARLALKPVTFVRAPADRLLDAAAGILPGAETALVVDPPRRGLEPGVLEAIERLGPSHLIYVSCAADTLARDLRRLLNGGWRLVSVELFDMFPRTALFESIATLVR